MPFYISYTLDDSRMSAYRSAGTPMLITTDYGGGR
jgi:hypothetical protein